MKTETILATCMLVGLILKGSNIPGGNIVTIVAITFMAIVYFPFGFYFFSDRYLNNQNILLSIVSGMFLSVAVIGILFHLMNWPGANTMLIIGLVSIFPVLVISWLQKTKNKEERLTHYYNRLLLRQFLIFTFGTASFVLSEIGFSL